MFCLYYIEGSTIRRSIILHLLFISDIEDGGAKGKKRQGTGRLRPTAEANLQTEVKEKK